MPPDSPPAAAGSHAAVGERPKSARTAVRSAGAPAGPLPPRPDTAPFGEPAYHPDGPMPPPAPPRTDPPATQGAPPPWYRRLPTGRPRFAAAALCMVLGAGLLGGAAAGTWMTGSEDSGPTGFRAAGNLWRETPVDELFPRNLPGDGAGPGGADRRWIRLAAAPDSTCEGAFDELLSKVLSPVGCRRLVRATYLDETSSTVTTVGMVFTRAGAGGMDKLRNRFATENLTQRTDLMPRTHPVRGTLAADFGDAQRASWTIRVLTDAPVVVFAVSGFADGRAVSDPQPAGDATRKGQKTAPAQAGLGHDAQGIADRVERGVRRTVADTVEDE
ncbi:hypothetical protein MTQ01_18165 [Streptomyces sp. XM4193]|uniref:hypothetical protein n=1 Tax=Streptomyces sp. XM4193 TaxID=2929782 RepID=UPI001FFADC23|nr:hypothetical protein [Streptomyces sp. XM4193]MCK1797914.1 hypothetical protein [Streptomyces sp. XM4193]